MPVENLKVVYRPTSSLVGYDRNSRTHSPDQVRGIANSMREFGFTNPILLRDDNTTIGAGHGRWEAAKLLGLEKVPTITLKGLTDDQWRAYVIADNKLALDAGWDSEMLKGELAALQISGFDMPLTGFSGAELSSLMSPPAGNRDPEHIPDEPDAPISRLGDVWVLGDHRLICGDSTMAPTVEKLLGGVRPVLMVTDPPYGVSYDPSFRDGAVDGEGKVSMQLWPSKNRARGQVINDDKADWREAYALFPGDAAYVWFASLTCDACIAGLESVGFERRYLIIWNKGRLVPGRGHYHWKHEVCWYAVRKGGKSGWQGSRKESTVWDIDHRRSVTGHGTQKPVDCMRKPMENNSAAGDYVYDPFCGSGTSIIAGQTSGRKVMAVELNPVYVDVAVRRWMEFTGLEAFLDTGEAWSDVVAERTVMAEPAEAL